MSTVVTPPPTDEAGPDQAVRHSLRMARASLAAGEAASTLRFDLSQHGVSPSLARPEAQATRLSTRPSPPPNRERATTRSGRIGQTLAWCLAALGATTLGLGIGLLAWSVWGDQPGLWQAALAATLTGQGLLIVGLVQLVAVLWTAGRGAAHRLAQMHDEVRALRRASDAAAGRHAASASQFYADLAHGAGPEVLMGSLRGQLDALSARLR